MLEIPYPSHAAALLAMRGIALASRDKPACE
jgi:hypothetical protein